MVSTFRRPRTGTAEQYLWHTCHTATQRRPRPVSFLILRSMATKRNGSEKEKRREPQHPIPSFLDEAVRSQSVQFDAANESEQARLWAKFKQAEARLPPSSVAERSRALDRIYADLVTNSAVGSFVSSERGRKLTELVTIHDMLAWTEEQRRLKKAIFFTKLRAAALDVCAAARLWYFGPSRTSLLYRYLVADTRAWPDNDPPLPFVRVMAKRTEDWRECSGRNLQTCSTRR